MNAFRVDALLRTLQDGPTTRRALTQSLAGIALAAGLTQQGAADLDARKRRKRKRRRNKRRNNRPLENAFGCRNVGVACTSADQCCSGRCEGQQGNKTCRAHDTGGCRIEQDSCSGEFFSCTATNSEDGFCHVTTGNAPYCGVSSTTFNCSKDEDCIELCGPEAACAVCDNPDLGIFQVCLGLRGECLSP